MEAAESSGGGGAEAVEQAARKARALKEKAESNECYEERQMLWTGMTGRGWTALMEQCAQDGGDAAPEINSNSDERGGGSIGWSSLGGVSWIGAGVGPGRRVVCCL